jgi:hypothetical protein
MKLLIDLSCEWTPEYCHESRQKNSTSLDRRTDISLSLTEKTIGQEFMDSMHVLREGQDIAIGV